MVAVRVLVLMIFLGLATSVVWAAEEAPTHEQARVINYAKHNVALSMAELGDKIRICKEKRSKASTPDIDIGNKELRNISKKKLSRAILYLSSRNMYRCEGDSRLRASYDVQNLATVLSEYGKKETHDIKAANRGLLRPDISEMENGSVFFYLPEAAKQYLSQALGEKPFDPVKTMQANHLFPSHTAPDG